MLDAAALEARLSTCKVLALIDRTTMLVVNKLVFQAENIPPDSNPGDEVTETPGLDGFLDLENYIYVNVTGIRGEIGSRYENGVFIEPEPPPTPEEIEALNAIAQANHMAIAFDEAGRLTRN